MSNTSKPAREWADHLPEPIRSKFLANCDNKMCAGSPDLIVDDIAEAISWAFSWADTTDDINWVQIHRMAVNGEFNNQTEPTTEPNPLFTPDQWEWVKSLSTDDEMRKRMRAFCHAMLKATEQ